MLQTIYIMLGDHSLLLDTLPWVGVALAFKGTWLRKHSDFPAVIFFPASDSNSRDPDTPGQPLSSGLAWPGPVGQEGGLYEWELWHPLEVSGFQGRLSGSAHGRAAHTCAHCRDEITESQKSKRTCCHRHS